MSSRVPENATKLTQLNRRQVRNSGSNLPISAERPRYPALGRRVGILKKPGRQSGAMTAAPVLPGVRCGTRATPARPLGPSGREGQHAGTVSGGLPRAPAPRSAPGPSESPRHWDSREALRLATTRCPASTPSAPSTSLVTPAAIPRIQFREHRAEVNRAEAALHG